MPIFEAETIHKVALCQLFYLAIGGPVESPDTDSLTA